MSVQLIYVVARLLILAALQPGGQTIMEPVSLQELQLATAGEQTVRDPGSIEFRRVATDSRSVQPGDLFWALKGDHHDGHDFIADAARRGAVACVIEGGRAITAPVPCLIVPNSLRALQDFARWHRSSTDALVVGITGTVGKTTTREMIHSVLSQGWDGCRSRKNYNNHIGLPLCVLDIEPRHEFAILEMGASRLGEIRDLALIASPEIGVVTGVGIAHLEGFGSIEAIAQAKGELVAALPASGFAVLNGDDPRCRDLARRACCRVLTVGQDVENTYRARSVEVARQELRFELDGKTFVVPAAGRHHLTSALAAIAVAREVGMSLRDIADGLARFLPAAGRCEVRVLGNWTIIDDTYNANPNSVQAACELLRDWSPAGRRILVLGDMAELGDESAAWHEIIGRKVAETNIDRLAVVGRFAAHVMRGAHRQGMAAHQLAECGDFDVLTTVLGCWAEGGDVVLVKGSRSMQMERVIERLVEQIATVRDSADRPLSRRISA